MDVGASFGLWMKKRRKALDLTQSALAKQVGCSTATIEKIEADARRPSAQIAALLAEALEIPQPERESFLKVARGERVVDRLAGLPLASQDPSPSTLPISPTPLIGRQPELAEIARLLGYGDCRLLTLVGPGGIGKTRLAIQVATNHQARFPDGVFFVPLVGVSTAEFIPPAIADTLGVTFSGPTPPKNQILHYLNTKKLLLVLDNFEHLLDNVDLVVDVFNHAHGVKMLVTSREPLGIQGEWLFEVQGLPVPLTVTENIETNSAVTLFLQSVRRSGLDRPVEPIELAAVLDICRLVGGWPLGIVLAASWARVLSYQEIAAEIRRGMDFLSVSARGMPERHRSLRAVFDQSWKLLDAEEQQTLQRVSVFRGGFTRQAAEYVADASLAMLASLMTKSLISRTESGRYELHEAVRQFAAAHLAASPELTLIRDRHCEFYLSMLRDHERPLRSAAQQQTIRQLTGEFDNIREAWSQAVELEKFELIRQALRSLGWLCDIIGWLQEGIDQIESVVQALLDRASDNRQYQATIGQSLAQQGMLYFRQGYFMKALAAYDESLAWLRPLEDSSLLIDSLVWSGVILNLTGAIEQSQANLAEGLAFAQAAGDEWSAAYAFFGVGFRTSLKGNHAEGYSQMLSSLAMWRELGDPSCIAIVLNFISPTAVLLGYLDEAEAFSKESLDRTASVGDRWGTGTAYRNLGQVALARGNLPEARLLLQKSLNIFSEVVTGWDIVLTLDYSGQVSLTAGDRAGAEEIFLKALRLALEMQTIPLAMGILVGLSRSQLQALRFEQSFLLSTFVVQNPASTQETRDTAAALALAAEDNLSAEVIQALQKCAARQSLDTLAPLIFSGELDNDLANDSQSL